MGVLTGLPKSLKYATEIIDPNAKKLHDDIEQLLNDLNRERIESSKVAGEKGETISTDLVKFDTISRGGRQNKCRGSRWLVAF
jgi:hypothetical protein